MVSALRDFLKKRLTELTDTICTNVNPENHLQLIGKRQMVVELLQKLTDFERAMHQES